MVIIYINYDGQESSMLHTKFRENQPAGSGEEDFWRVFTIYGRGGHLGHVTWTIYINFRSPFPRRLHIKFGFDWPSGFRGEDVWKCERTTTDDGRRIHGYPISSPLSLRLRWAKKAFCFSLFESFMCIHGSKYRRFYCDYYVSIENRGF